jgi:hypothetical protein
MAVLDFYTDLARLKEFHNIKNPNPQKRHSYMMYWFLRRHPIQILEEVKPSYDINELVSISIFFPRVLRHVVSDLKICCKNDDYDKFFNLLFYNVKYRTYTKKTLELAFSAFASGYKIAQGVPK